MGFRAQGLGFGVLVLVRVLGFGVWGLGRVFLRLLWGGHIGVRLLRGIEESREPNTP